MFFISLTGAPDRGVRIPYPVRNLGLIPYPVRNLGLIPYPVVNFSIIPYQLKDKYRLTSSRVLAYK